MITVGFAPNVSGALRSLRAARATVAAPSIPDGPFRDGIRQAGLRFLNAQQRRFQRNAAGGGDWAPLAPSTLARKNPNKGILRKTDELMRSLTPGAPGNVMTDIPRGVRAGTSVAHGIFHMTKTANRPARKPMDKPDDRTKARMKGDIARGLGISAKQWAKVNMAVTAGAPSVTVGAF